MYFSGVVMDFASQLLVWFHQLGRKDLPWQENLHPYRVWVSEIMLQQTQVATVIPYYQRFMQRFSNVHQLAAASIDEVLTLWSGLGYYARGRNLHKAAGIIVDKFQGQFPEKVDDVVALPGVGRSTAHAILSISFGQKLPILDGNVKRVLTRFKGIHEYAGLPRIEAQLWDIAYALLPERDLASYSQAIMDLGAMICTAKNPSCLLCPIQSNCYAFKHGKTLHIPAAKPKRNYPIKTESCLLLHDPKHQKIWLETRAAQGIWGGLLTPLFFKEVVALQDYCKSIKIKKNKIIALDARTHKFTHFQLNFQPFLVRGDFSDLELSNLIAYDLAKLQALALPTPIKLLLQDIYEQQI